jgi:hypothetical protein
MSSSKKGKETLSVSVRPHSLSQACLYYFEISLLFCAKAGIVVVLEGEGGCLFPFEKVINIGFWGMTNDLIVD